LPVPVADSVAVSLYFPLARVAGAFQVAKFLGEHFLADAFDQLLQFSEPLHAVLEMP